MGHEHDQTQPKHRPMRACRKYQRHEERSTHYNELFSITIHRATQLDCTALVLQLNAKLAETRDRQALATTSADTSRCSLQSRVITKSRRKIHNYETSVPDLEVALATKIQ